MEKLIREANPMKEFTQQFNKESNNNISPSTSNKSIKTWYCKGVEKEVEGKKSQIHTTQLTLKFTIKNKD